MSVPYKGKVSRAFALLPFTLFVLSSCALPTAPQAPSPNKASGFEFYVEPQTGVVTLSEPTSSEGRLQPQNSLSDTRILTPYVDIKLKDLSYQFVSAKKLIVRFRVENLTQTNLEQPFFLPLVRSPKTL